MSRISIDVTPEEHQRLKAMAALQGKSIKEFVLECTLGAARGSEDLAELEALLDKRLSETDKQGVSSRGVDDIFRRAREESRRNPDA